MRWRSFCVTDNKRRIGYRYKQFVYWHAFVINETGPSVSRQVTSGWSCQLTWSWQPCAECSSTAFGGVSVLLWIAVFFRGRMGNLILLYCEHEMRHQGEQSASVSSVTSTSGFFLDRQDYTMRQPVLSLSSARKLSRDVPTDASFLWRKAAVLDVAITERLYLSICNLPMDVIRLYPLKVCDNLFRLEMRNLKLNCHGIWMIYSEKKYANNANIGN
jgi:hypothetical protein